MKPCQFFLLLAFLLSPVVTLCQYAPSEQGINPGQDYIHSPIDSVNTTNGNLVVHIPLISYKQRGTLPDFTLDLRYNGKSWSRLTVYGDGGPECIPPPGIQACDVWLFDGYGMQVVRGNTLTPFSQEFPSPYGPGLPQPYFLNGVADDSGARHNYYSTQAAAPYNIRTMDGSGVMGVTVYQNAPVGKALDSKGVLHSDVTYGDLADDGFFDTWTDPDGNTVVPVVVNGYSLDHWVDSVGRNIPAPPGGNRSPYDFPVGCTTYQYPSTNGGTAPYIFCYQQYTATSAFGDTLDSHVSDFSWSTSMLSSVTLPNGTSYTFNYNNWGDLSQITLPQGGTISYQWKTITYGDTDHYTVERVIQSRTVNANDGTPAQVWNYDFEAGSDPVDFFPLTVTDPLGNQSTYWPGQDIHYQGTVSAGNILSTVYHCLTGGSQTTVFNFGFSETPQIVFKEPQLSCGTATKLSDGSTSSVTTTFDASVTVGDPFNQPTDGTASIPMGIPVKTVETDFGPGSPGATLRTTTTQYKWQEANGNYLNANLLNLPCVVTVYGPGSVPQASGCTPPANQSNQVAQTVYGYDENNGSPQGTYGNLTSVAKWLNTGGGSVETSMVYNSHGMPTDAYDANWDAAVSGHPGNHITTTYDSTGLFPASVQQVNTGSTSHTDYYSYDANTGNLNWHTDQNGSTPDDPNHTTSYSYDNLGRITSVHYPDGGGSTYCYTDEGGSLCAHGSAPYSAYTSTSASPDPAITSHVNFNGLGQPVQRVLPNGATAETTYDLMGRVASVSNPHFSSASSLDGYTTYAYDALDRKRYKCNSDNGTGSGPCVPGNSYEQWDYNGSATTFTDEAGRMWKQTDDALGRLVAVNELGTTAQPLNLETDYTYDTLSNLKTVNQIGKPGTIPVGFVTPESSKVRRFLYDSLSRLINACNPEALAPNQTCDGTHWSTIYDYDANSNLLHKTDARGVVSSFTYDALNRITSKSSNDGITRYQEYIYDGSGGVGWSTPAAFLPNAIGRLSHTSDDIHIASFFGYDAMGRMTLKADCLQTDCSYSDAQSATYDLAGNMSSLTYPDGRVVDQVFDSAGRLAKVSNRAAGSTPAFDFVYGSNTLLNPGDTTTGGIQYTAAGAPQSFVLGNGVGQFNGYNNRLQPCHTMASTPVLGGTVSALLTGIGPGNLLDRESFYSSATSPCGSEAGNNGNIHSITDKLQVGNTQTFSYDNLNRLATAFRSDGVYNHTYNYDSFGNMLLHDNLAPASSVAWSIDQTTNRLLRSHDGGVTWGDNSYDASGNLHTTSDGIAPSVSYQYNANNQVLNINSGSTASYLYDAIDQRVFKQTPSGTTDYIYFNNQAIAEKDQNGNWTDYIYANGQKIARVLGSETLLHAHGNDTGDNLSDQYYNFSALTRPIQSGDKISWRQFNLGSGNVSSGLFLTFSDYSNTGGGLPDTTGAFSQAAGGNGQWVTRTADLSAYAGKTITYISLSSSWGTTGVWDTWYADITVYGTDGAVATLFNGMPITGVGGYNVADPSHQMDGQICVEHGTSCMAVTTAQPPNAGALGTHYFLDDHLGTAQMELSAGGWPVWQGQFMPFGQEIVNAAPLLPGQPDGSSMHYKFTGKERDSESGLDYFGARYYASSMGRWTSPDPGKINMKHLANPQKWNKYNYVLNNPLSMFDPDGLQELWIQFRAYIPQATVGPIRGDNRGPSTQENASSRASITMHIETDPAKNHGNPLLGYTQSVSDTHNTKGASTPPIVTQAPTATASQDPVTGQVTLNVKMNVRSGDAELTTKASIRSDVNIGVNEAGTQATVQGSVSGSPAFEINFAPQGGSTTNLPIQGASPNPIVFIWDLPNNNPVNKRIDIKLPEQSQ